MVKGVTNVTANTVSKKDFTWDMDGTKYKILNVPCEMLDMEEESFIDLDVAIKMEMIRELMLAERIPAAVDFELVVNMKI